MTGVTHGADASRLREIAQALRGQGERVQDLGGLLEPQAGALREAWSGADSQMLLHEVTALRPVVASIGATLVTWAEELRGQADEQTAGSGEGGVGRGVTRDDIRDGVRAFTDVVGKVRAPGSDRGGLLSGGFDAPLGTGMGLTNAIGDTPGEDPGELIPSGQVSKSSSSKAGAYKVTDEAKVSVSPESVDAEGRSVQTTEITLSREGALELGKKIDGVGVTGTGYAGAEVGYSVTAPVGVDPLSIDPLKPETWPEGVSVRFDESFYAGYGLEGNYRGLILGIGQETGTGSYVEVSKGPGDEVTVLVGDERFRSASTQVGLGTDDLNVKAGADNGVSSGTAREVVIDRSTPEGRRTYESILLGGGEVPEVGTKGVVDVARVDVLGTHASLGLSATAGDWSAGGTLAESQSGGIQRTHADGTKTLDWTGGSPGREVGGTITFDADGTPRTEDSTYYMRLEGVSPEAARDYNRFYLGEDVTPSGENNVVLTFDHHDLTTMRAQAAQTVAAQINAYPDGYPNFPHGDGPVTAQDVLDHVDGNPDGAHDVVNGMTNSTATETILRAQSDEEILRGMMAVHGPLEYQQEIAVEHHTATGQVAHPVGEVKSRPSA